MPDYAANLRRLMARFGLTLEELVGRTALDERTLKGILSGSNKPHARTLHRLAGGLGVDTDELFQEPSLLAHRAFDRQTNPAVDEMLAAEPELFAGWGQPTFDELYSRFGAGGQMTAEGVRRAAEAMNHRREVQRKIAVLLESGERELLCSLVDLLYGRIVIADPRAKPR